MSITYQQHDAHARAVRQGHQGRTSRGLSVEIARFALDNPIFGDDRAELLADLKRCAANAIGAGCEPRLRPLPGQSLGARLAASALAEAKAEGTPLPRLFRAPVGAWVHLHTKRYFTLFMTCGVPTKQGVLTSERRS